MAANQARRAPCAGSPQTGLRKHSPRSGMRRDLSLLWGRRHWAYAAGGLATMAGFAAFVLPNSVAFAISLLTGLVCALLCGGSKRSVARSLATSTSACFGAHRKSAHVCRSSHRFRRVSQGGPKNMPGGRGRPGDGATRRSNLRWANSSGPMSSRPTLTTAAHIARVKPGPVEGLSDWIDPRALRSLVDSVRDAFSAAPVWARVGLLAMLTFAVGTGVFRVARTIAGRLVVVTLIAALVGFVAWGIAR